MSTRLIPGSRATELFVQRASHADHIEVEPLTRMLRVLMASEKPNTRAVGVALCEKPETNGSGDAADNCSGICDRMKAFRFVANCFIELMVPAGTHEPSTSSSVRLN